MKPIASRNGGWVIAPLLIESTSDGKAISISYETQKCIWMMLPDGLTFSQFLEQYAACIDAIYFID